MRGLLPWPSQKSFITGSLGLSAPFLQKRKQGDTKDLRPCPSLHRWDPQPRPPPTCLSGDSRALSRQRGQVPWLAGLRKKARCAWTPGVCLGAPRGGEPGHFCPPGTPNADVALLQTESRGPAELPRWKTGQSVLSARSQEPAVPWTRLPHAGEGPDPPPPAAARPERPEQGRRREALSPSQPSPAGSLSAAQSPADLVGRGQNARGAASPLPRVRPPRASEPSALWVWGALCWPFLRPAGNWVLDIRSGERGTARGGGDTASPPPVRRKPQGGWACVFHASFCSPSEGVCPARTTAAQPAGPVLWLPLEFTVASGNPSIKII